MYVIKNHSLFLKSFVLQVGRDDIIKHEEAQEKIWNNLLLFLDSNLRSWKFTGYTTSEWFILPLIKYLGQNMTTDLSELYILSTYIFSIFIFVF